MFPPDKQITVRVHSVQKINSNEYYIRVTDMDGITYYMSSRDPICIGYVMNGLGRLRQTGPNYFIPNNSQIIQVSDESNQYVFRHLQ